MQPGDEILVESPVYEPLITIFEPFDARVIPLQRRVENNFAVDIEELKNNLTSRTRLIVVTTLHNPTGTRLNQRQLREIGEAASVVNATVIVDEVYQDFCGETISPSFLLGDNFITTNSLTKVYGLGGLRVGWAFAAEKVVKRAYEINNNMGVNNPFPSDHLGYTLMANGGAKLVARRARDRAEKHWRIVKEFIDSRSDLSTVTPEAGIICFPRFTESISSRSFVQHLQSRYETVVAPGYFFGDDRGFRLGFGCEENMLREGLGRLANALDSFTKNSV